VFSHSISEWFIRAEAARPVLRFLRATGLTISASSIAGCEVERELLFPFSHIIEKQLSLLVPTMTSFLLFEGVKAN